MRKLTMACAAIALMSFGSTAFAQMAKDDKMMSSDKMMAGDKMAKMSDADMKKWKSCEAMSHDMMMKDKKCMSMKKNHDMMMKKGG